MNCKLNLCTVLGICLLCVKLPCYSREYIALSEHPRPYAVVVDSNTAENPEWGQVTKELQRKYSARIFITHYPEMYMLRKALSEYMPWYVCFVAQPEQATREMISTAARVMTWLDDDPYEDAVWAVLTGLEPADAMRIVHAAPFQVRKGFADDDYLPWLEQGLAFSNNKDTYGKYVKEAGGSRERHDRQKDTTAEIVDFIDRDCDFISSGGHASEHTWYLGYPDVDSSGRILHNAKGDIYGTDTQGRVHRVTATNPKIYHAPGNCLIGHIDELPCLCLSWIHNGVNQFFGYLYVASQPHFTYRLGDYFLKLQDQYTFAEATYVHWLALRFAINELIETYPSDIQGGKGTVLYGDPGWEARVKRITVPTYDQDLKVKVLPDDRVSIRVDITINRESEDWGEIRPVVLFPLRIEQVQITDTDVRKICVKDNFMAFDLWHQGEPFLPVGTRRYVVLSAVRSHGWTFLSDEEINRHLAKQEANNLKGFFEVFAKTSIKPEERIRLSSMWEQLLKTPGQHPLEPQENEERYLDVLRVALKDKHLGIRCASARLIGCFQFKPSTSIQILRQALLDKTVWETDGDQLSVRSAIMSSLGMFGDKATGVALDIIELLPKLSLDEATVALSTLGKIGRGDDRVFAILREVITDRIKFADPNGNKLELKLAALEGLEEFGVDKPAATEIIIYLMDNDLSSIRERAVRSFTRIDKPNEQVVAALLRATKDESWRIRRIALRRLSRLEPMSEDVVNAHIDALRDEVWQIRYSAVRGLASMTLFSTNIENALQYAAEDKTQIVREKAEEALQKVHNKIPS